MLNLLFYLIMKISGFWEFSYFFHSFPNNIQYPNSAFLMRYTVGKMTKKIVESFIKTKISTGNLRFYEKFNIFLGHFPQSISHKKHGIWVLYAVGKTMEKLRKFRKILKFS